jgi:integrase family protein with SAM-like domain
MALEFSICEVRWERYQRVAENPHAREWLKFQAARGLAANTIAAYGRDLDSYLGFLQSQDISFESVIRPTIGPTFGALRMWPFPGFGKRGYWPGQRSRTQLSNSI